MKTKQDYNNWIRVCILTLIVVAFISCGGSSGEGGGGGETPSGPIYNPPIDLEDQCCRLENCMAECMNTSGNPNSNDVVEIGECRNECLDEFDCSIWKDKQAEYNSCIIDCRSNFDADIGYIGVIQCEFGCMCTYGAD